VAVPLEELYAQALASKKRLVLAGHSLGGAVALLCTIKLLRIWAARQLGGAYALAAAPAAAAAAPAGAAPAGRGGGKGGRGSGRQGRQRRNNQHLAAAAAAAAADPTADPNVRCITFAAPAVANESLAAEVVAAGWDRLMSNFVQPGARGGVGVGDRRLRVQPHKPVRCPCAPCRCTPRRMARLPLKPHGLPLPCPAPEDVVVPFVNKLLKAEEGSAALERTLRRLASQAALASPGRADRAAGVSIRRLISNLASAGRARGGLRHNLGRVLSLDGLSRAASATASAAASVAAAAAAAATSDGSEELHSQLLEDSAYKQTAAMMSLAMASACNLPAGETLGNAPHAPEAAARLRHADSTASANGDAPSAPGGAGGPGRARSASAGGTRGGLRPAISLQGGLPIDALVAAAEAGVIGLTEAEAAELEEDERARIGGAGWLARAAGALKQAAGAPKPAAAPPAAGASAFAAAAAAAATAAASFEGSSSSSSSDSSSGSASASASGSNGSDGSKAPAAGADVAAGPQQEEAAAAAPAGPQLAEAPAGEAAAAGRSMAIGADGMRRVHSAADVACLAAAAAAAAAPRVGFADAARGSCGGCEDGAAGEQQLQQPLEGEGPAAAAAAAAAGLLAAPASPPRRRRVSVAAPEAALPRRSPEPAALQQRFVRSKSMSNLCSGAAASSASQPPASHPLQAPTSEEKAAAARAAAEALMQRRGGRTLRARVLWSGMRAAALAAPHLLSTAAAAAVPAGAAVLTSLLPAALVAGAAPLVAVFAPLVGIVLPALLALPPAAVAVEVVGSLIVTFCVPRTYTIGQQWVLTAQGLEPALKPLDQYRRDWAEMGALGGLFPGHRMVAYRNRLVRLLPGERLQRCPAPLPPPAAPAAGAAGAAGGVAGGAVGRAARGGRGSEGGVPAAAKKAAARRGVVTVVAVQAS
jgi:hypothetical protein